MAVVETLFTMSPDKLRVIRMVYPDGHTRTEQFMVGDDGGVSAGHLASEFDVDLDAIRLLTGPAWAAHDAHPFLRVEPPVTAATSPSSSPPPPPPPPQQHTRAARLTGATGAAGSRPTDGDAFAGAAGGTCGAGAAPPTAGSVFEGAVAAAEAATRTASPAFAGVSAATSTSTSLATPPLSTSTSTPPPPPLLAAAATGCGTPMPRVFDGAQASGGDGVHVDLFASLTTAPLPSPFVVAKRSPAVVELQWDTPVDAWVTAPASAVVHSRFGCDSCGCAPIRGVRYHCPDCGDVDMCGECYWASRWPPDLRHTDAHHAVRLARPVQRPLSHTHKSLGHLYANMLMNFGPMPALGRRVPGRDRGPATYSWLSYQQLHTASMALAAGLHALLGLPVAAGDGAANTDDVFVVLSSDNRPEWAVADFACVFAALVTAPVLPQSPPPAFNAALAQTPVRAVVCSADVVPRVLAAAHAGHTPHLQAVVCMDALPPPTAAGAPPGVTVTTMAAVVDTGRPLLRSRAWLPRGCDASRLSTVVFSSGSTGKPKGVMLSDASLLHRVQSHTLLGSTPCGIEYAPLAHTTARFNQVIHLMNGGRSALFCGPVDLFWQDVAVVKPTVLVVVPRLWDELRAQVEQRVAAAQATAAPDQAQDTVRREVLDTVLAEFGGRVGTAVTGGAKTSVVTYRFLKELFRGATVADGYGATEVGGIASDGNVLAETVKLVDTDEYKHPMGEVWVRAGGGGAMGYYGDPELTADRFKDGWYRTGDIGIMRHGKVHVVDRASNVTKLSHGEFVCVEDVAANVATDVARTLAVVARHTWSFVLAVVHPALEPLLAALPPDTFPSDAPPSMTELCSHPAARAAVLERLRAAGVEAGLPAYELPAGVHLTPVLFTPDNGLLTASHKPCLREVWRQFEYEVTALAHTLTARADASSSSPSVLDAVVAATQRMRAASDVGSDACVPTAGCQPVALDSLSAAGLAAQLEAALRVRVPVPALLGATSTDDVARLVLSGGTDAKGHAAGDLADADTRLSLEPIAAAPAGCTGAGAGAGAGDTAPTNAPAWLSAVRPGAVVLTGATGFVGAHLLAALCARDPVCQVVCLVRCDSAEAGTARLLAWLCQQRIDVPASRLLVVPSDLSKPLLGLPLPAACSLFASAAAVWHVGAVVNWVLPYARVRAANTVGTVTLCRLVLGVPPATRPMLHFASTMSVPHVGDMLMPLFMAASASGYGLSKWVAESCLRRAVDGSGLWASFHRLGLVLPHSTTGAGSRDDVFCRFLRSVLQCGAAPDTPVCTEGTPVDVMVNAMLDAADATRAALAAPAPGGDPQDTMTYHHVSPGPTWTAVARAGVPAAVSLPYAEWEARVFAAADSPLQPLAAFFLGDGPPKPAPHDGPPTFTPDAAELQRRMQAAVAWLQSASAKP